MYVECSTHRRTGTRNVTPGPEAHCRHFSSRALQCHTAPNNAAARPALEARRHKHESKRTARLPRSLGSRDPVNPYCWVAPTFADAPLSPARQSSASAALASSAPLSPCRPSARWCVICATSCIAPPIAETLSAPCPPGNLQPAPPKPYSLHDNRPSALCPRALRWRPVLAPAVRVWLCPTAQPLKPPARLLRLCCRRVCCVCATASLAGSPALPRPHSPPLHLRTAHCIRPQRVSPTARRGADLVVPPSLPALPKP